MFQKFYYTYYTFSLINNLWNPKNSYNQNTKNISSDIKKNMQFIVEFVSG